MEVDYLSTWKELVSTTAVIVTIGQFLCGSLVCRKYFQKGGTGDSSGFPFACGFLSSCLWLKYGYLKGDSTIVFVNTVGCALQMCYILVYFWFTHRKFVILYQFTGCCAFLATVYAYIQYEPDEALALGRTGLVSCAVTLLFIGAPLLMLVHVMRVRSTESLPFPVILMSFFVSALWFLYGIILQDPYIKIPNALGALLAALQLSLFVIYPSSPLPSIAYTKLPQLP